MLVRQQSPFSTKRITLTDRFRQEVEKLKIDGQNLYKLILPVQGQREETRTLQCKFLFSYADMQMSPQYQFIIDDMKRFPIIDTFEPLSAINTQIYHKITTLNKQRKLMKYYNFTSFADYQFKRGLYQISLYTRLRTTKSNRMEDYFVIYKGNIKQLVMTFENCLVSLHDVLYYRQQANFEWEEHELLLIMKMLCEGLVELHSHGIVHRDVRPSSVFFSPLAMVNSGEPSMYSSRREVMVHEMLQDGFYSFINLQSARVVDALQHNDNSDLLTVKGVPTFTQNPIREALQKQQHKANYNAYHSDISGLKQTLLALVNLSPNNAGHNDQKLRHKHKVRQVVKFMTVTEGLTIDKLVVKVEQMLGLKSIAKPQSYYNMMRTFYTRELTICQNIETNLYYENRYINSMHVPSSVSPVSQQTLASQTQSALLNQTPPTMSRQPPAIISLPPMLTQPTTTFLQTLYIKTLYDLHKKDTFVPFMLEKLTKNFQSNRKEQNVELLMKVGRYFEDAGVKENEYYKEAILLLLQLAESERLEGFYKDHARLVDKAEGVFTNFEPQSRVIAKAKCILLKQKAYREILATNMPNEQLLSLKPFAPFNNQANFAHIEKYIFQSYELAVGSNLQFEQQLELIYSKAELYMMMQRLEESETYYMTGYQIATKNETQFMTAHNCTKTKAMFEYGLAVIEILKLVNKMVDRTPRTFFNIQEKLQRAKERFASVIVHPVLVIKCYVALGDLANLKEDFEQARQNYERAMNLLHAENATVQGNNRIISARIELEIVQKLINVLNLTSNTIESRKYEQLHDALKKEFGKSRKNQNKYSRKGKSTGGRGEYQQQPQQHQQKLHELPVIKQEEEEMRMLQSERIMKPADQRNQYEREGDMSMNMREQSGIKKQEGDHVFEF